MSDNLEWCFRILEVEPPGSTEEIKKAYRELVKVWHPDRFPGDAALQAKAQERLKRINVAFETLLSRPQPAAHPTKSSDPLKTPQELYELGAQHLANGRDVDGAQLIQRSAELGFTEAQAVLGHLFDRGKGVTKSTEQAISWWMKAANEKHAEAQFCLGCTFANGHGAGFLQKTIGDAIGYKIGDAKIESYKWFNLAVTNGYAKARGGMESIGNNMTQAQLNEARSRGARLYPKYPDRSARDIIGEWLVAYAAEISANHRFEKWHQQFATDFLTFKNLHEELTECLLSRLQSHFLNNHTAATADYFKDAGAGWMGLFGRKQTVSDRARIIAAKMMLDGWDAFSPQYICQKENILNQLWLRLFKVR